MLLAALAACCQLASAQGARPGPRKSTADLAADVMRALQTYRMTLEEALPLQEAEVREAAAEVQERQSLYEAGALEQAYVEQSRRRWQKALRDLAETRKAVDEADRMMLEAGVQARLARLSPLRPGGYEDSQALVRFNGIKPWTLRDAPQLDSAFERAFGRRLPISAFGQTDVHKRIGLDHRDAIDVAVHPDSPEGQWLMKHLRAEGIPFIGVREAIPGSSTGAHVHVGPASPRLIAR